MNTERVAFISLLIGWITATGVCKLNKFEAKEIRKLINGSNQEVGSEFLNVTEREVEEVLKMLEPLFLSRLDV